MTHKKKTMYITTPIYYVNGTPHIGHAYTAVVADFFKKFYEQRGQATYLLSGTDEHGQKVAQSAEAAGVEPLTWCDKHSRLFKEMCEYLLVDTDDFIRTTEERHKSFVQNVWKELEARGWLYKGTYNGWYSVRDEAFTARMRSLMVKRQQVHPLNGERRSHISSNYQRSQSLFLHGSKLSLISCYPRGVTMK